MRRIEGLLLACTLLIPATTSLAATEESPADGSVVRLRLVTDAGDVNGTGVVIYRETRGPDVVLSFLTSSRLFRGPDGEALPRAQPIRVWLDAERMLDVGREDVFIPAGPVIDAVVFRATTAATTLVARPISYETPTVGGVFLVAGHDRNGAPAMVAERIRFQSTLLAVGDRDASTLFGCLGAPAISQHGVFGLVTECSPGRAPVIALFSMARSFIERRLPQLTIQTSVAPQFVVIDRPVAGPLVLVGCDATKTGDLDVPFDLGSRELAIDATAAFVQPHEVRLAEVTVLKLQDRSLRLGFTLGGVRSPPGVPLTCPQGHALVSLRVNVAVVRALQ
jgi:hypothetical protein